ncbi:MAG: LysR family transcriptional regulator [Lachnospiraceae bacterium]|nr:LysR family transcriptional regulator [Lachnospiraceae bacterium]
MIRQIRYFQSVVRNNSFSKAAEECRPDILQGGSFRISFTYKNIPKVKLIPM